jgi:hypothetical protein
MNADNTWNKIVVILQKEPAEVVTVPSNKKEPLWFNASFENGNLYVQNSISHKPSTKMSQRRKISKNDFETVYSYYHRWANGERYLRQKMSSDSRNTAYIFALIAHFE